MGNSEQVDKYVGKEFTADDLDDPNKYNFEDIKAYFENSFASDTSTQPNLIKEVVSMVIESGNSTIEFKFISPYGYDDIIYRDKRANFKYVICRYSNIIGMKYRVTKDHRYIYYFASLGEMRGYFHLQDQINSLNYRLTAIETR